MYKIPYLKLLVYLTTLVPTCFVLEGFIFLFDFSTGSKWDFTRFTHPTTYSEQFDLCSR